MKQNKEKKPIDKSYMSNAYKDINDCWCMSAVFDIGQGKTYCLTMSGAPATTKVYAAKRAAYEALYARCEEFLAEHPGAVMLNYKETMVRRKIRPLK